MLSQRLIDKRDARKKLIKSITTHYRNAQKESVWDDYDRKLAFIPADELATCIDIVMSSHEGMAAPKPATFIACYMRRKEEACDELHKSGQDRFGSEPYPGGLGPTGERWMTAAQARARLERMKIEQPEVFEPVPQKERGEAKSEYIRRVLPLRTEMLMAEAYRTVIRRWEKSGEAPEPLAPAEMRLDDGPEFVEPVL